MDGSAHAVRNGTAPVPCFLQVAGVPTRNDMDRLSTVERLSNGAVLLACQPNSLRLVVCSEVESRWLEVYSIAQLQRTNMNG